MRANELEKILRELRLDTKMKKVSNNSDTNFMICCPFHGERRASCGISLNKLCGACFSCGQSFHLTELVMHVLGVPFFKAVDWLEERVKINKQSVNELKLRRFEDEVSNESYEILPNFKLAVYQSGKVMHNYLRERGFTPETVKVFKIGWDEDLNRITVPIFDANSNLQGFIGRTVFNESDKEYFPLYGNGAKYKLYPPLKKSFSLFPIHKLEIEDELILVEGTLDALWMHQNGFKNTLSIITANIASDQVKLIEKLGVKSIILALDNDSAGKSGIEKCIKAFKGDYKLYGVNYIGKDPCDHSKDELEEVFAGKYLLNKKVLKRFD